MLRRENPSFIAVLSGSSERFRSSPVRFQKERPRQPAAVPSVEAFLCGSRARSPPVWPGPGLGNPKPGPSRMIRDTWSHVPQSSGRGVGGAARHPEGWTGRDRPFAARQAKVRRASFLIPAGPAEAARLLPLSRDPTGLRRAAGNRAVWETGRIRRRSSRLRSSRRAAAARTPLPS